MDFYAKNRSDFSEIVMFMTDFASDSLKSYYIQKLQNDCI